MSWCKQYGRAATIAATVAMSLSSAPRKPYSPHEKGFYADAATLAFVNPGLTITANSATIASDGTITVVYTLSDPSGRPLDNTGVATPGTISTSFVAGVLPNGSGDYTAYTTTAASGTLLASTQQPGADSGGVV
ncbi:MAG TPA: hypothetical protein VNU44_15445, partial [Bryobacteraceae bacterium]|nr:hypothetical protein [Bryobacteraceae bacterium]